MKKILLLSFILLVSIACTQAQVPSGYYSSAQGLTGYALKTELSSIITNGHNARSYGDLWTVYYSSDRDNYYENDGSVLDIYSEDPSGSDPYNFTIGTDQCGSYSGENSCYNREHLFPKSYFNDQSPMVTDMHHIYPTDGYVNGQRGSFPFGEVNNASWTSLNGSKKGNNSYNYSGAYTGTVFEPIDEFKGDVARTWLYMATRYESQIASWETNSSNSNIALNGTSNQVFEDWMLDMLINWHNSDPVSQKEIDRNDEAYTFQGNRNPFIDNPQYVAQIWGVIDTQAPTAPTNLAYSNLTNNSVNLSWTAATDNIGVSSYTISQNGTNVGSTAAANTTYTVTNLTALTSYTFEVYALDAYGNISTASNTVSVTTLDNPGVAFSEDFNDCTTVQFTAVSELSDLNWECTTEFGESNTGAYQMNGYANGNQVASTDWLITNNKIDFDAYTNETLSFFTAATFGNSTLQLLYSSDYNGGNSPSNFTWQAVPNIAIPLHSDGGSTIEETYFSSIDISSITGQVYFAFKYDTSNGDSATRYTVDSFTIAADQNLATANQNKLQFSIYPNPSNGILNIDFSTNEEYSYNIYDLNGRLIIKNNHTLNKEISVKNLSSGLYLIQVTVKGLTATKKLIIH